MRDMVSKVTVKAAIVPTDWAGNDNPIVSAIIDRAGYDALTFVIATGSLADAGATWTVLIEDGDNSALADAAAVVAGQLLSQTQGTDPEVAASFTQAADSNVRLIGYNGLKRYVRMTITPAGNAGAQLISAVAILAERVSLPFAQPAS